MAIFFTLPPDSISYPYILINANNPMVGIRYIVSHRKSVEAVIIDSGIEIFRDPMVKDYPGGYLGCIRRQVLLYRKIRSLVPHAKIYVTPCDYCDDYNPRSLWLSDDFTNIERTVVSVVTAVDFFPDVPWLIPIQGWYRKPSSLIICLEYYKQLGILNKYDYYAVANICTEQSSKITTRSIKNVYHYLRQLGINAKLHIFGLKIASLESVERYIHSFDSTAWTRPVSSRLHSVFPWSAKSEEERVLFFCEYMLRLARHSVALPMEVFRQCIDQLPRIKKALVARYTNRAREIEKLLLEVADDLRKIVY